MKKFNLNMKDGTLRFVDADGYILEGSFIRFYREKPGSPSIGSIFIDYVAYSVESIEEVL